MPKGLSLSPELWEAIVPEILELAREALDGGDGALRDRGVRLWQRT